MQLQTPTQVQMQMQVQIQMQMQVQLQTWGRGTDHNGHQGANDREGCGLA